MLSCFQNTRRLVCLSVLGFPSNQLILNSTGPTLALNHRLWSDRPLFKEVVINSLTSLWNSVANDFATRCCTSAALDIKTVHGRVKHEGDSFLTITLPAFAKDFQKSLDIGRVERHHFSSFGRKRNGGLPRFLGGFLSLVFDPVSGVLLDSPDIDAILAIRQLTLLFSKYSLECSKERTKEAMKGYVKCEQDVRAFDSSRSDSLYRDFEACSKALFARALTKVDREVYYSEYSPQHGPGAVADNLRGNGKYRLRTWTKRLEEIFPSGENLIPNWRYYDQLQDVDILEPGSEIPVKVIAVPKTMKTPRIIAKEPACMQYMQQALLPLILDALKRDPFLRHALGFDDQVPNQRMALVGSLTGELATLDLSEASDRVSNQLVRLMTHNHSHLHKAVDACRSRRADVSGFGVLRLAKFASMGSALTFPIEAMVFLTIVMDAISKELNTSVARTRMLMRGRVRIYGDDIIVPTEYVPAVIGNLEAFGLLVNRDKSFWTGKFRESCGKEYYDGFDVSVVKCRRPFPTSRQCVPEVISLVSLRNQLYYAGCWGTVKWLDGKIRKLLRSFPTVLPTSSVLGRHSFLGHETQAADADTFGPLVKGWKVRPLIPASPLDDTGALLKFFLKRGEMPSADERHLERAGRAQSLNIILGWGSPL
jgi:hypothetical protein